MKKLLTRSRLPRLLVTALAALIATSASAQLDFSNYVAFGDSLTAGFVSGSLNRTYQTNSYPALIHRQATDGAAGFQQPLVTEPGIPAILELKSLIPSLVIGPKPGLGQPANLLLPRPYNNMAVPGADVVDLTTTITDGGGLHDLILRGTGFTQLQQGVSLQPKVATVWIGNNDVLSAAVSGRVIEGVTLTPVDVFEANYRAAMNAIAAVPSIRIAVANIPSVTSIPYVTTIQRVLVNPATQQPVLIGGQPVPLIGPEGPLVAGDFVLLPASAALAQGIGIPVAAGGSGQPLPDSLVLSANEVLAIGNRVNAYNAIISTVATEKSALLINTNQALADIQRGLQIGGITFSGAFLTGGMFSYDGVHPSAFGYAYVANLFISGLNARFGEDIPFVDLGPLFFQNSERSSAGEGTVASTSPPEGFGEFVFTEEAVASLRAGLGIPTDAELDAANPPEPPKKKKKKGKKNR